MFAIFCTSTSHIPIYIVIGDNFLRKTTSEFLDYWMIKGELMENTMEDRWCYCFLINIYIYIWTYFFYFLCVGNIKERRKKVQILITGDNLSTCLQTYYTLISFIEKTNQPPPYLPLLHHKARQKEIKLFCVLNDKKKNVYRKYERDTGSRISNNNKFATQKRTSTIVQKQKTKNHNLQK